MNPQKTTQKTTVARTNSKVAHPTKKVETFIRKDSHPKTSIIEPKPNIESPRLVNGMEFEEEAIEVADYEGMKRGRLV